MRIVLVTPVVNVAGLWLRCCRFDARRDLDFFRFEAGLLWLPDKSDGEGFNEVQMRQVRTFLETSALKSMMSLWGTIHIAGSGFLCLLQCNALRPRGGNATPRY